jgi:hypothetical protein
MSAAWGRARRGLVLTTVIYLFVGVLSALAALAF